LHPEQIEFVRHFARLLPEFFTNCRVLEVGSLNLNGSVRVLFRQCDYLGIDIGPGPGVDLVCRGQDYEDRDGSFDTVISCECMEHNPYWRETFENMVRLCRPGGLVVISCAAAGRPEHGTARSEPGSSPLTVSAGWSYYRNLSEDDFTSGFPLDRWFAAHRLWTNWATSDLYFGGVKRGQLEVGECSVSLGTVSPAIEQWLHAYNSAPGSRVRRIIMSMFGEKVVAVPTGAKRRFKVKLARLVSALASVRSRRRPFS